MRYIAISDIHGCADEFEVLVNKLNIRNNDIIICMGDATDKGPNSPEVLQLLWELGAILVNANHDERYRRYRRKGLTADDVNKKKIKEEYKREYEKLYAHPHLLDYLVSAVPFTEVTVGGQLFSFVHAGITPYMELYNIAPQHWGEFLRVRYLDADTHGFIRMVKIDKDKYPDEVASWRPEHDNVIPWQKAYNGRYGIMVHGHIITGPIPSLWLRQHDGSTEKHDVETKGDQRIDVSTLTDSHCMAISIDTGAHKGWNLTALVIEDSSEELYFVQQEVEDCYEP